MAVVQISKIQIRRGKKNTSGMPQLASGELAWAIDTQELYIGNGAVGEGAPAVGNTKILTERDSILELSSIYQYKYDSVLQESPIVGAVYRSIQSRLDEGIVNATSLGIFSDSMEDQTEAIQNAFNEIATKTKVILEFDPGVYIFSQKITIPSNLKISGFGKEQTVFKFIGTGVAFETVDQSSRQMLKDFSIEIAGNNSTCLRILNSKYLETRNIKFTVTGATTTPTEPNQRIGIRLVGNGSVANNKFYDLEFKYLSYGVLADSNASFNTFENCLLEFLYQGFSLGLSSSAGANYNSINNSIFDKITRQGLYIHKGLGNVSRSNRYKDVGSTQSGTSSSYSIIRFDVDGNSSVHDFFERQEFLEENNTLYNNNPYVPDIEGIGYIERHSPRRISLTSTSALRLAFRVPLNNATLIKINYVYRSTTYNLIRTGTLTLSVDKINSGIQLVDDHDYVGSETINDNLILSSTLESKTQLGLTALHARINYINNNLNDINTFTYTYSILS